MSSEKLYIFFRHHKAAGTWMSHICRTVCKKIGLNYLYAGSADEAIRNQRKAAAENPIDKKLLSGIQFISLGNPHIEYLHDLRNFVGFNLIRDPRDILVSAYYSHLNSHPTVDWPDLERHRKALQELSKENGLILEMNYMQGIFDRLYIWDYSLSNILTVKYEDVTRRPHEALNTIFRFLGLLKDRNNIGGISKDCLDEIVTAHDFSKFSEGRKIGQEDTSHHYRKGLAGDWKNHFTQRHKALFKSCHGPLLLRLNYETDNEW